LRTIEISLDDDLAERLEWEGSQSGLALEQFVGTVLRNRAERPRQWMPREEWAALASGDNCPICRSLASSEWADPYGFTIAELRLSRLRLVLNQSVPGYCVLLCREHVVEPYDLSAEKRLLFWEDTLTAAQAIAEVLQPAKMNIQILGNAVPHLHSHIIPRYYGDWAPGRPIDPSERTVLLKQAEYEERVVRIRAALASQSGTRH
jgi:diadenosine tetraphosphate (Ap4A) HIT family hydrolase